MTEQAPKLDSVQEKSLKFISPWPTSELPGMNFLRREMKKRGFTVENLEYKVTVKREITRPINPKNPNGPAEKVIAEDRVNVNADFKSLRQLKFIMNKEPTNVLAVTVNRIKGVSFILPLIFDPIFKSGKQVVALGTEKSIRRQLLAVPDLKFKTIPEGVSKDPDLEKTLLDRAGRQKGMQATLRELADMPFFPERIREIITKGAAGQAVEMSDAEAVNLILLADCHNRYSSMFRSFELDMEKKSVSVEAQAAVFAELTQDEDTAYLEQRLHKYLFNKEYFLGNAQVFQFLHHVFHQIDKRRKTKGWEDLSKAGMWRSIRNLVLFSRSQRDPALWRKCLFIKEEKDQKTPGPKNKRNLDTLTEKLAKVINDHHSATSQSFSEIYAANNIQNLLARQPLWLASGNLPELEFNFFRTVLAPWMGLTLAEKPDVHGDSTVFSEAVEEEKLAEMKRSVHFVSRSYGIMTAQKLREKLKKFMTPGLSNLSERYGGDFFDILYEVVAKEGHLPLSRNQLGTWLKNRKLAGNIQERGWSENSLEIDLDPFLKSRILNQDGSSVFPVKYTQDDFRKDFDEKRSRFLSFFQNLEEDLVMEPGQCNPSKIFVAFKKQGHFNFESSIFRQTVAKTFLGEEFNKVVQAACTPILGSIAKVSSNRKAVLKIPYKYESLLQIAHTFDAPFQGQAIHVHLIPVAVAAPEEIPGLSREFSENLGEELSKTGGSEARAGLVKAMETLAKYHKIYWDYFKFCGVVLLDRLIEETVFAKLEKQKIFPRHIKFHVEDSRKWMIGGFAGINSGKLSRYAPDPRNPHAEGPRCLTFGQLIEVVQVISSLQERIEFKRIVVRDLLKLIGRFSKASREMEVWKKYSEYVVGFHYVISKPLEEINEKRFKLLRKQSDQLARLVSDNPVEINKLRDAWEKRYPSHRDDFLFFEPFLEKPVGSRKSLQMEIRLGNQYLASLIQLQCVVFFPEGEKKFQLNHMLAVKPALDRIAPLVESFVETSGLNREQIRDLSKAFPPGSFFLMKSLEPEQKKKELF